MQIEFSNADTTVQLPQSLDSVSLQAPGPLRIEDDGAGVLPAATTLDAGTGLSVTDQGDGIVRLDAADVPGSNTQVIFNDNGDLGANAGLTYDGTLTVQGDGTLLDLQDSGGNTLWSFSKDSVSSGPDPKRDFVIDSNKHIDLKPGKGHNIRARGPIVANTIFSGTGSFTLAAGRYNAGNLIFESGSKEVGRFTPSGTFQVSAQSGQTDPLLQLNDETGSALIEDQVSGDRKYHQPGKGVILTSPDGSTTSKLTALNGGGFDLGSKAVVQGDGTLLDLQDSGGNTLWSFSKDSVSSGPDPKRDFVIDSNKHIDLKPGKGHNIRARGPIVANTIFSGTGSFTLAAGRYNAGNLIFESGSKEVGRFTPSGTFQVSAQSGQTDPLLQLNDETGSALIEDQVSGDRKYHQPGKGIILTSPDGSTTKRVYLDNSGSLATEPA